ncbi:hypothetical protein Tco_0127802 [Tanacetum coccineum]
MVQPWQRITRERITQSFSASQEISFPPIANNDRQENPIVIEAVVEGHLIRRMYAAGGSASESRVVIEGDGVDTECDDGRHILRLTEDLGDKANLMAEITLGFYVTQETQFAQSLSEQAQRRGPRPQSF